jgi:hypothetical protein
MQRKRIGTVDLPLELASVLEECPEYTLFNSIEELFETSVPTTGEKWFEVSFPLEGKGDYTEARVCLVKNGIAVKYTEPYTRRRDPECMLIGDDLESDKQRYKQRFGGDFSPVRQETLAWLKTQKLACYAFTARRRVVYPGADRTSPHSTLRILPQAGSDRRGGDTGRAPYASAAAGNRPGNLPKRGRRFKEFLCGPAYTVPGTLP